MDDIAVILVAAGRGERAGAGLPKQYRDIAGKPLLRWTVDALQKCDGLGAIQIVINPEFDQLHAEVVAGLDLPAPVAGGATRQASVLAGLEALAEAAPRHVMIHDAARLFVGPELIARLRDALAEANDGAIPVLSMTDTIKQCWDGTVVETVDRTTLYRAQTPQAFRYDAILAAHRAAAGTDLTDDAAVAERAGLKVAAVAGDEGNIKVTTAEDFDHANARLEQRETRVGTGFDVHAFAPGDHVMLCGVRIEHEQTLGGDSDADVGLHVLVDAMLGALGEGDLGVHFPVGDPTWKGRASSDLVAVACGLMRRHRARLVHADITLICQKPRLARHQPAMNQKVAELLGVDPGRVNVKVTSTDGLGFTGRGEGIAGQAAVTVEVPAPWE
jgi:2-C-methyl-D-erythritol 4-phosphate cytidylyltransferase/2-C-methyl-D-erythritol 2,4-cyclodiphosphate synthase